MNQRQDISRVAGVGAGDGRVGLVGAPPAVSAPAAPSRGDPVSGPSWHPPFHRGRYARRGEALDAGGRA